MIDDVINELPVKQQAKVRKMQALGYLVFHIAEKSGVYVIGVRRPQDFGMIYPSGLYDKAKGFAKSINIDWHRARQGYKPNRIT